MYPSKINKLAVLLALLLGIGVLVLLCMVLFGWFQLYDTAGVRRLNITTTCKSSDVQFYYWKATTPGQRDSMGQMVEDIDNASPLSFSEGRSSLDVAVLTNNRHGSVLGKVSIAEKWIVLVAVPGSGSSGIISRGVLEVQPEQVRSGELHLNCPGTAGVVDWKSIDSGEGVKSDD